jgi:flagellar protein FlbB
MAELSDVRPGARIFILFLLIIVLTLGGIIWFDYLGLIDARSIIRPVYSLFGLGGKSTVAGADDPLLLERERLAKEQEALTQREQAVSTREAELAAKEKELTQLGQDLNDRQTALEAQQKALIDSQKSLDDRRVNLEQVAEYLTSMAPAKAVAILENQDDQYVIDVFRIVETQAKKAGEDSIVPVWLSLMKADMAARLQRKMAGQTTTGG